MQIWDKQDRVWLERDGVDAHGMLRHDRYSLTEDKPAEPEVAAAPEPVQAAPATAQPARKKPGRKARVLAALNGIAGKSAPNSAQ